MIPQKGDRYQSKTSDRGFTVQGVTKHVVAVDVDRAVRKNKELVCEVRKREVPIEDFPAFAAQYVKMNTAKSK